MVMVFHFAFVLVDNSVHLSDFVIESCFCDCLILSFVLVKKNFLIVMFVPFF